VGLINKVQKMKQYLDLLNQCYNGRRKHPSRASSGQTTNSTTGCANLHFSHDLQNGFPLLTTRKVAWKGLIGELRSFLNGDSNEKDFAGNGCNFWKPWARDNGDLGPIYGVQWNRHGQLDHVLDCLRNRPTDRRMVVSAWRPDEHQDMVLPPCHVMWAVTMYHNRLSLAWMQRSCDFPIGVPYNIASYALLTHVLAAWAEMEVGTIDCIFCDAHVYDNQKEGVVEQLLRVPTSLPEIHVGFRDPGNFFSWDVELCDYDPQPAINFGKVEV